MANLRQHLSATPRRLLLAIGRARHIRLPWEAPKTTLVEILAQALVDSTQLQPLLLTLSQAEQAVLEELLLTKGRLHRRHLTRRHGDLRPYRPWQVDAPRRPWANPISPTERLWYLGLIFVERETDDVVIPTDLIPHLPVPQVPIPSPASPTPDPAPANLACHDLAYLLALLQRDDIYPLHGRWLPPRFLAVWGQHCLMPPLLAKAGSELQTGRRLFLHYLAQSAGLLRPGDFYLKPTPAAWLWLKAAHKDSAILAREIKCFLNLLFIV